MGVVFVKVRVSSPVEDSSSEELDFLIDTGARLSVVPREVLEGLGFYVDPVRRQLKELPLLL